MDDYTIFFIVVIIIKLLKCGIAGFLCKAFGVQLLPNTFSSIQNSLVPTTS